VLLDRRDAQLSLVETGLQDLLEVFEPIAYRPLDEPAGDRHLAELVLDVADAARRTRRYGRPPPVAGRRRGGATGCRR